MTKAESDVFRRQLLNIKSRDIQSVAARLGRTLLDYPRITSPRTLNGQNRRGECFDSVWDEHIGSTISCVKGISISRARTIFEVLHLYSNFLIVNNDKTIPNIVAAYANNSNLQTKVLQMTNLIPSVSLIDRSAITSGIYPTYTELGYTLVQKTLGYDTGRDYDLYEFCKEVSGMDVITHVWAIHRIIESKPWIDKYNSAEASAIFKGIVEFAPKILNLVTLVNEIIMDLSHLADGFSSCDASGSLPSDVSQFNPQSTEEFYQIHPDMRRTSSLNYVTIGGSSVPYSIRLKKAGKYQMAFETRDARLRSVTIGGDTLSFDITKIAGNGAVYLTDTIDCGIGDRIEFKMNYISSGVMTSGNNVKTNSFDYGNVYIKKLLA